MSKPVGPYTPVVRAGDWLVVSGQVGAVDGKLVSGGTREQLQQALTNLRGLLESEGASMTDVVKTTVFLRHMDDFAAMNDTYVAAFGDHRPARSAIGVAGLPLGALVEVEAWARKVAGSHAQGRADSSRPDGDASVGCAAALPGRRRSASTSAKASSGRSLCSNI